MGVAAYYRGNALISRHIKEDARDPIFEMMDDLNELPKYQDSGKPLGPIHFVYHRGVWFAECPKTGFGFWYKNLREAVRRWNVEITEYRNGIWVGIPRA